MSGTDSPMYLDLQLQQAHFNSFGQYYIKISIHGSTEKQNDVQLFVNNSKTPESHPHHTTEPYLQSDPMVPLNFTDSMLTFQLPPGFTDQDVYLIAEAYKVSDDPLAEEDKCGEATLLVYPNRDSLFQPTIPSETANEGSILYKIEKQLVFTSESEMQGVSVSVGTLWLSAILRNKSTDNISPPVKKKRPSNIKKATFPNDPGPSTAVQQDSLPSTPLSGMVLETPLGPLSSSAHPRHLCGSYVAREGYCEVAVLVHAAVGLPVSSDGHPPQPYVTGKSKRDANRGLQSQSVTHTSIQPTHYPAWDEVLLMEFPTEHANHQELILSIADHPSKELLVDYRIPVSHLKPYYQYNLELVKPNQDLNSSSRLYVSLILKYDKLVKLDSDDAQTFGMEVLLRGVDSSITNQLGPLIAVFRVVQDWNEYKDTTLTAQPCTASIAMTTISFPSPHPTSFSVAGASMASGSPQVTVSGEPVNQPQWNQMFFFPGDVDSLFTRNAAIVIEFYRKTHALSDGAWMLANPVGYCSQMLNQELASALKQEHSKLGLRINGLPIQGLVTTASGTKASVGIVLRLLMNERPDILVAASQFSSLPLFGDQPNVNSNQFAAQPIATNDKNPFGLPPFDAVQRLLPFTNPQPSTSEPLMLQSIQLPSTNKGDIAGSVPLDLRNTMDMRTLALLDYQMKEVDRYRTAMRKVAADFLHLKQENSRLEEANSRYRRDLSQHDEISRMMVSANDLDDVTHSELIQKFVLLKKKLSDESTKRQELQKRTQKLQNDLIKKNEKEKSLVKLEEAHESQQALLQKMQTKLQKYKALQDTCKKQEQVIVELEKLLSKGENGLNLTNGEGSSRVYIEENVRLRLELERYKGMSKDRDAKNEATRVSSPKKDTNDVLSNSEKLELYQKLERSEGRILGLEKQLADNARKWAKEKTVMQTRLNELLMEKQTGFSSLNDARFTPDIIAQSSTNNLFKEPRRSSPKLDPLTRKWP